MKAVSNEGSINMKKKREEESKKENIRERERQQKRWCKGALYCGTGAVKTLVKGTEVVSRNII